MNKFQEWCKEAYPFVVAGMNGKKVECYVGSGVWKEKTAPGLYLLENKYRIAPNTIKVNGHDVPAPEKTAPEKHIYYWVPNIDGEATACRYPWDGDYVDGRRLKCGLVHLSEAAAIAHAKAILDVGESK